jgi:uncharacterized BrkB/YihY/UPF0761 family membrane protein
MKRIKAIWKVVVQSFKSFGEDKILKYSAALAYTTIFSMGPLLVVIIRNICADATVCWRRCGASIANDH